MPTNQHIVIAQTCNFILYNTVYRCAIHCDCEIHPEVSLMKKVRILLAALLTVVLLASLLVSTQAEPAQEEAWQADLLKLIDPEDVPSTTRIDYKNTYAEGVEVTTHDISCEITVNSVTYGCEFIFESSGEPVQDWTPVQDWLGLDNSARMNLPGTVEINWCWRLLPGQLTREKGREVLQITKRFGRANWDALDRLKPAEKKAAHKE